MTVVLHPDGALGVGLGGSIDLPPEQVYGCLAETLRVAFTGVRPPKQTALFSRTVLSGSCAPRAQKVRDFDRWAPLK